MLAWQFTDDICNVATLGSASNRAALPDLAARLYSAALTRYPRILAVYDADPAGDRARGYLSAFPRVKIIPPPDHDLTDYFRSGQDFRFWLASILTTTIRSEIFPAQKIMSKCDI